MSYYQPRSFLQAIANLRLIDGYELSVSLEIPAGYNVTPYKDFVLPIKADSVQDVVPSLEGDNALLMAGIPISPDPNQQVDHIVTLAMEFPNTHDASHLLVRVYQDEAGGAEEAGLAQWPSKVIRYKRKKRKFGKFLPTGRRPTPAESLQWTDITAIPEELWPDRKGRPVEWPDTSLIVNNLLHEVLLVMPEPI